jgi:hypothetical protein
VASYSISCEFDHINRIITLSTFTLSGAHCTMLDLKDWVRCKHSCTIVESPEGGGIWLQNCVEALTDPIKEIITF